MIRTRRTAVTWGICALMSLVGVTVGAAPAFSDSIQPDPHTTRDIAVMGIWYTPHSNYFTSKTTCDNYGRGATGDRTGTGYVPGTTNWHCYLNPGDSKYSVDLWYP